MNNKEKIEIIQSLKEKDLREKLLIPLFSKMGFIDPIHHHHHSEKGKDIVMKEIDLKFKKTYYLAVVVKAGNVTGSASGNTSYFALLNQVRQALNEPYKHIYDLKKVSIDQVIIVISGRFLPTSLESIYGTLKKENLDKGIKEPIDINKLINLVDEFFKEFWNESENEKSALIKQRNYLLNNFSIISKIIFADEKNQKSFLKKVTQSEIDINLFPYKSVTKYIADIDYKTINIDEIDEFYTDRRISNYYADIKRHFFSLKKDTQKILLELQEPIEILIAILNEKNPEKMIELIEELSMYIGSHGITIDSKNIQNQEEFEDGLTEYKAKKQLLSKNNLTDFYNSLYQQISEQSLSYLIDFFRNHKQEERNIWLGMKVIVDLENKNLLKLEFYEFNQEPKVRKDSIPSMRFYPKETEINKIENNNTIIIEHAINYHGFRKEIENNIRKKAENSSQYYKRGFEKGIFKILGYYDY